LPARAEQPCSLLVDRLALADALIRRRALIGVEIDQIIGRELRPSTGWQLEIQNAHYAESSRFSACYQPRRVGALLPTSVAWFESISGLF
jgi:hypothetical protein